MTILEVVKSRLGEPGPTGEFPCPFCKRHGNLGLLAVRKDPPAWYCPTCMDGGDVVKFVAKHDHISIPQATELLASAKAPAAYVSGQIGPTEKAGVMTEFMRGKFKVDAKLEKASTS